MFFDEGYYEAEDMDNYEKLIKESPLIKNKEFGIEELAVFFRFQMFHNIITDSSTGDSLKMLF